MEVEYKEYKYPENENRYCFRISRSYDECQEQIKELAAYATRVAIYQHDADEDVNRTHVHGIIRICSRGEDTLRTKFFKKYFAGNKQYQLATTYIPAKGMDAKPVNDKYITYMSKGHLEPVYVKDYTQVEIDHWKSQWIDYSIKEATGIKLENGKIVLTKEVEAERKKKKYDIVQAICMKVHDKKLIHDEDIITEVIRELTREKQVIGQYKIMDYFDAVTMYSNPGKMVQNCLQVIARRQKM